MTVERKKTAEQNDKILNLNEKLAEREQDIKYLKTETMKCQNYFDENLKIIKEKEQTQSAKYNDTIQQLSEGLKNFEDENKV